jgi:very-short-patch-repair endonuclease
MPAESLRSRAVDAGRLHPLRGGVYETHSTRAAFERDRALQAQGSRVLRITSRRLHDDAPMIAAELRSRLDWWP